MCASRPRACGSDRDHLAHAAADVIAWHRKLGRETEFDMRALTALPRVDIVYS